MSLLTAHLLPISHYLAPAYPYFQPSCGLEDLWWPRSELLPSTPLTITTPNTPSLTQSHSPTPAHTEVHIAVSPVHFLPSSFTGSTRRCKILPQWCLNSHLLTPTWLSFHKGKSFSPKQTHFGAVGALRVTSLQILLLSLDFYVFYTLSFGIKASN